MDHSVDWAGDQPAGTSSDTRASLAHARSRAWRRLFGVSLLLAFVWFLVMGLQRWADPGPRVGGAAPDFVLTTFDGKTIHLADLQGKGVVLNFWASWCDPCRAEADLLEAAWRREQEKQILFVGVNYLDQEDNAKAFLAEYGITYPNGPDLQSTLARRYAIDGLPTTYFIDPAGKIAARVLGPLISAHDLSRRIDAIR